MQLILASRSSIRMKILTDFDVPFVADPADIDEDTIGAVTDDPIARATLLATEKAWAVAKRHPHDVVLGVDQVAHLNRDQSFLEKPRDAAHQLEQLMRMCDTHHTFFSGFAIIRDERIVHVGHGSAMVRCREFTEAEARAYVATGEGRFSCCGYELENRGRSLIEHVAGGDLTVLGLPLRQIAPALRAVAPELPFVDRLAAAVTKA